MNELQRVLDAHLLAHVLHLLRRARVVEAMIICRAADGNEDVVPMIFNFIVVLVDGDDVPDLRLRYGRRFDALVRGRAAVSSLRLAAAASLPGSRSTLLR